MWRMIAANVLYQRQTATAGLIIVLLLASIVTFGLPLIGVGPAADDDFKLYYFFPVLMVFLGLVLAFTDFGKQRKEFRLLLSTLLPNSLTQIGLARVLTPVVLLMACVALAVLIMNVLQLVMGTPVEAWRSYLLTYFGGLFFIATQLPILAEEMRPAVVRSSLARFILGTMLITFVLLMLLRSLSEYIDLLPQVTNIIRPDISMNPEVLSSSLSTHGLGWLLVFVNAVMFRKRESMTG